MQSSRIGIQNPKKIINAESEDRIFSFHETPLAENNRRF
jgi:hypothetical protein